jgi:IS4 transposase
MSFRVVQKRIRKPAGKILRDDLIVLKTPKSRKQYPARLLRVVMLVEINGKEVEMTFITNNLEWAAASVGALYQSRWGIEVFFKQPNQSRRFHFSSFHDLDVTQRRA